MSFKDIRPGKYLAKMQSAKFIESSKGTPGIQVDFKLDMGQQSESISWTGWMSAAAMERTMGTLVNALGFNGDDAVDAEGNFNPKAFDLTKVVELDIQLESFTNSTTGAVNTAPKVKWVNIPGTGTQFKALAPEVVKTGLQKCGFRAAFLAAKAGAPKDTGFDTSGGTDLF